MENVISFESSIKKITINDEDGNYLTTLKIDTADVSTKKKFAELIKKLENASARYEELSKEIDNKEGSEIDKIVDESRIHVQFLDECASELDAVFGVGTIKAIYAPNYEINPDFVPDEYQLLDFIDKVIPLMNTLFKERFERNNSKYNIARRGKHNKTKAELIEEHLNG